MSTAYAGTGALLRLAWRRDRVMIPLSILALSALSFGSAQATLALYPTEQAARESLGSILANPAVSAMYGPITDTRDGLAVFKTVMMGAVFVGVLAQVIVRRHTRLEEEQGRLELIGAGAVGRRAPLAAAVALALMTTVVTALLSMLGLIALGLDPGGSLAFAVSWTVAGLVMVGVAAIAAQLTASARAAAGIGFASLGAMFVLRAVGDTTPAAAALSWLSPLGWVDQVGSFGADRVWVFGLALAFLAGCLALATMALERRDLGAGLLAARPGRSAALRLSSPLGLAWRVDRAMVAGWVGAYAVLGVLVGALARSVSGLLANDSVRALLEKLGGNAGTLTDTYFATELHFTAAGTAAAGIVMASRLAAEERSGRLEPVLATATSRTRVYAARVGLSLALMVAQTLAFAIGCALVATAGGVDTTAPRLIGAALATLPAAWLLTSSTFVLYGFSARWVAASWGLLIVSLVLGEFGSSLSLPAWLVGLSPLHHLSALPGGEVESAPLVVMTALAAAVTGVGLWALRRRDLA